MMCSLFCNRLYDVYPIVEMDYSRREEGYLTLGQYFDGANAAKARLGFTAPIIMRYQPQASDVVEGGRERARGRGEARKGKLGELGRGS
jgi:hypothetical protein